MPTCQQLKKPRRLMHSPRLIMGTRGPYRQSFGRKLAIRIRRICNTCSEEEVYPHHELINRPWAKLGVDLCEHDGRQLLVVVHYYSNFPEVDQIRVTTSTSIIKSLSIIFAHYGVPDDHAQSNGKAETSMKAIKRLQKSEGGRN